MGCSTQNVKNRRIRAAVPASNMCQEKSGPIAVSIRCAEPLQRRVRYVFDTLFMACGLTLNYVCEPPPEGPWILYATSKDDEIPLNRCVAILHRPQAWALFETTSDVPGVGQAQGLTAVFPETDSAFAGACDVPFDLVANAFYFLASWSERWSVGCANNRHLHRTSVFARFGIAQDIVDRYLERLLTALAAAGGGELIAAAKRCCWPSQAGFAIVLSHDVDFVPSSFWDNLAQGAKSVLRELVHQKDIGAALTAGTQFLKLTLAGRDPYGCVPEILAEEKSRGVKSSFQVAVAHRHVADVTYDIRNERTREYLRAILVAGFEVCLHGSYRSTERRAWYQEEAALLAEHLGSPIGSRQHFLSFHYDALFEAQEEAGIQYDMSMGFPDQTGPRAGFSYPYFPYCLADDRPYNVVEIGLFFMDVTLRSYMGLTPRAATDAVALGLNDLKRKRGAASVVWHPIVFGGARDPGYNRVYWDLVQRVLGMGGIATDGRTINDFWRQRARAYASFA